MHDKTIRPLGRTSTVKRAAARLARLVALAAALLIPALPSFAQSAPLSVAVSILPQKFFTETIGGERVQVMVMVPPGSEPHTYEPKPGQMKALAETPLYLAIGAPFENAWLPRFSGVNPNLAIVDVDEGIEKLPMAEHDHGHGHKHEAHGHGHDHGHAAKPHDPKHEAHGHGHDQHHGHDHGEFDPHVWTTPSTVRTIALNTALALTEADPEGAGAYRAGLEKLLAIIDATDRDVRDAMKDVPEGTTFMVFHPAWAYFARDYGLREISIEQSGREPGPREMAELTEVAGKEGIRVIFIEPQFARKTAETIARQIKASVATIDPLAEDWPDNLRAVAKAIAESAKAR